MLRSSFAIAPRQVPTARNAQSLALGDDSPSPALDLARVARALQVPIARTNTGQYAARASRGGVYYLALSDDDRGQDTAFCPCPDFTHRGDDSRCKHVIAAMLDASHPAALRVAPVGARPTPMPVPEPPASSLDAAGRLLAQGNANMTVWSWILTHPLASPRQYRMVARLAADEAAQACLLRLSRAMSDRTVRSQLLARPASMAIAGRLGAHLSPDEFAPYLRALIRQGWDVAAADALMQAGAESLARLTSQDLVPFLTAPDQRLWDAARRAMPHVPRAMTDWR